MQVLHSTFGYVQDDKSSEHEGNEARSRAAILRELLAKARGEEFFFRADADARPGEKDRERDDEEPERRNEQRGGDVDAEH